MRILIVDDHTMNRKLLRAMLEAESHQVEEASDGLDALQVLDRSIIEAVISDVLMPNMDGFRLCLEIRKSDRFRTLPFLVYTSTYNSPSDRKLAAQAGADRYLIKPAPLASLMTALNEAVQESGRKSGMPAQQADEQDVIKQYNAALVTKLEERSAELAESLAAQERAEAKLHALHAQLQQLLEHSPAVLYAMKVDQDSVVPYLISENMSRLLGFTAEESLSVNWWLNDIHPDDRREVLASMSRTVNEGASHTEYRMRHKDGDYRWVDDNRRAFHHAGQSVEIVGVWADVTPRKRAEQRLKLQHAVTRVLAEATPTTTERNRKILETICRGLQWDLGELWMMDPANRTLRFAESWHGPSPALQEFVEVSRHWTFGAENGLPGWVAASGRAEWTSDVTQEVRCERRAIASRAGLHGWVGFPIRLRSHVVGIAGFFSTQVEAVDDEILSTLTAVGIQVGQFMERQQLSEQFWQAQKMDALGRLAGGIAHDFNNILAAILGYAELARIEVAGNEAPADHLDQVLRAADRARVLVGQILAFTRQQKQERRPIQLRDVITDALKLLRATTPAQIEFAVILSGDARAVLADSTQVHQIVMNLGTNAAHAIGEAQGQLTVTLENFEVGPDFAEMHPDLRAGSYVRLSIADTGHGMDQATMSRIFEPFFTTKELGQGTGLGLAVVLGIVQTHDGVVKVDSEPGKGTTFHLYFPALEIEAAESPDKLRSAPRGQSQRIMLVDDEEPLARSGKAILESLGYVVDSYTNPIDAVEVVVANPDLYDLAITDQMMPKMTGMDLAKALTTIRPGLPIILTSGYTAGLPPEAMRAAGIRKLLLKPFPFDVLGTAVHEVLSARTQRNFSRSG